MFSCVPIGTFVNIRLLTLFIGVCVVNPVSVSLPRAVNIGSRYLDPSKSSIEHEYNESNKGSDEEKIPTLWRLEERAADVASCK